MQITVKKLIDIGKSELDNFLVKNSNTILYTSYNYLSFLQTYLSADCFITVCKNENDEITGIFPYVIKEEAYGSICNSLPYYGSNGGIIINENTPADERLKLRTAILGTTISFIKNFNLVSSTFITNPLDGEGNEFFKLYHTYDLVDERIGQITHLPPKQNNMEDILMKRFEDPRPRNIRKAVKMGVNIYSSYEPEDLEFLYEVHNENITGVGGKAKEKDFFTGIPHFFSRDQYKVYIAELEGKKIAAVLLFYFNRTVEYFTPAVIEKYRDVQPTALIIYKAMLDAIDNGYAYWNWGGTWLTQTGVYDFKKKWGTTDHPYYYYTKIYDESVYTMPGETLNQLYKNFYVIPFNKLKPAISE